MVRLGGKAVQQLGLTSGELPSPPCTTTPGIHIPRGIKGPVGAAGVVGLRVEVTDQHHWRCGPGQRSRLQHRSPPADLPGGLVGAGYWGSSGRTLAAWGPFGPDVTSNSTAWPSSSER